MNYDVKFGFADFLYIVIIALWKWLLDHQLVQVINLNLLYYVV